MPDADRPATPGRGELRLDGRIAVVTGAGSGIGAAHARLLAARGASVVVNDLDSGAADAVVEEIAAANGRAVAHHSDISTEHGAASLVGTATSVLGGLDIVVNNAGLLRSSPFAELDVQTWDHVVAVNLRGTFLVTHAAWPHLAAQRHGRVISTTSNSGLLGVAGSTAYASAKAGVWGLTRSLALEGAELGIGVNAVAPLAYTSMSAASEVAPDSWRTGEGDQWSRRLDARHVAAAVVWLAHEHCTLNGQVLSVAGGRVARFALHVTDGFDRDELTPEHVRDHEADLLADEHGAEYRTAAAEGRDLHRRLLRRRT